MLSHRTFLSALSTIAFKRPLPTLFLCLILSSAPLAAEEVETPVKEEPVKLKQVVVTATKTSQALEDTPVITNLITRAEIEATGAENVGEVLEHTAGIVIHRDGHGDGVQLQGLSSEYVLILVDGDPQIGRIAGKLDMARLAVENVEQIEIVKGATSSLFGNSALGGVINIITRKATSPFSVQVSQGIEENSTLDSRGTLELKRDNLNALLSLSYNHRDLIDLDTSNVATTIDGYANITGSARAEYQLTSATDLVFLGQYFTQDQEGIRQNGPVTFDALGDIENFSGSVGIKHTFGNLQNVTAPLISGKLYATRYDDRSTVIDAATGDISSENLTLQDMLKGEIQFDSTLWGKHQLTLGGEVVLENLQSQRIVGGERDLFTNSVFVQDTFRPIAAFTIVVGGRFDYNSEFGTHLSPKLSAMYRVTDNLRARASYGQGFRAPDFRNLYLDFSNVTSGYRVLGNPNLQPESSHNWNLGLEYRVFNGLLARVHTYRNDLSNLIEAERVGETAAGGNKFEYQNISTAYTEGVDVEAVVGSIGGFTSTVGYAYLRGADKETGLPLLNRSTHSATLKFAYLQPNSSTQIDLRGRYASRWGLYDDGDKVLEPEEYAPSYWVWNLRLSQPILEMFSVSIGCNNIFDFKIPTFYTFTGRSFYGNLALIY